MLLSTVSGLAQITANSIITREQFLSEVAKIHSQEDSLRLIQIAFDSKRLDLVEACIFDTAKVEGIFEALYKVPHSDFKNKIILMLLQKPWSGDNLPNGLPQDGSRPKPVLHIFCLRALNDFLPDEKLLENMNDSIYRMSSLSERQRLAKRFTEVLKSIPKTKESEPPQEEPSTLGYLWLALLVGLLALLGWKLIKRKR